MEWRAKGECFTDISSFSSREDDIQSFGVPASKRIQEDRQKTERFCRNLSCNRLAVEAIHERLFFGEKTINSSIGVNHCPDDKARAKPFAFQDRARSSKLIDVAYAAGINSSCARHCSKWMEVCDYIRSNEDRLSGFRILPVHPYAATIRGNAATEHGILNALSKALPYGSFGSGRQRAAFTLQARFLNGIPGLIDAEMKGSHGCKTPLSSSRMW